MIKLTRKIKISEVEENRFYKMPKFIIHDESFADLGSDAKILYMIMRDRHELSIKNNWVDQDGYVYIIYTRENMMKDLNLSKKTVIKAVNELKKYDLIEEKRQGVNKPNLIYVLTIDIDNQWKCKNYTSGVVKNTLQEVNKLHQNDTNINKTNNSKYICDSRDIDFDEIEQLEQKLIDERIKNQSLIYNRLDN